MYSPTSEMRVFTVRVKMFGQRPTLSQVFYVGVGETLKLKANSTTDRGSRFSIV